MLFAGDGLGHGPHAKDSVDKAIKIFSTTSSCDPSEIVREMNADIKKARGLVGTVAVVHFESKKWEICGIEIFLPVYKQDWSTGITFPTMVSLV